MKEALDQYVMPNEFAQWALGVLQDNSKEETQKRDLQLKGLRKQLSDLDTKLSRLLDMKISPNNADGSLLSDEEYKLQKQSIVEEKSTLTTTVQQLEDNGMDWLEQCEEFFDFATNIDQNWETGTNGERKLLFTTVFGSNSVLMDQKLRIQSKKPFIERTLLTDRTDWRE